MQTLLTRKRLTSLLALLLALTLAMPVGLLPLLAAEPAETTAETAAPAGGDIPVAAEIEDLKESRIESVVILESKTMLEVTVRLTDDYLSTHEKTPLYLFELLPFQSTSALNEYEPVGMMAADKTVVFSVPFDNEELRVQAKYIAAEKRDDGTYAIVTKAAFIDNPEILAKYDTAYPTYPSKKGLAHPDPNNLTDVLDLGVSHAVLDVPVNEYIRTEAGADSTEYHFGGESYYVDRVALLNLDWKVSYLTDAGVHVYLNFLLSSPSSSKDSALSCLYCEGVSPDASYYALNTRNEQAVMYFTSFVSFMAKRYGNVKSDYGFSGSFIVGTNVNSNRYYHSMGEKSLSAYLDMYTTAFRIVDTALRSVYANGRTYVSVADNLNTASLQPDGRVNSELDYSVSDFLKLFDEKITMSGDIPWRVALNIRPTVKGQAEFWQSPNISDASSTPFVNLYNIGALTDLLKSEALLYEGQPRSVAVTSDAIPSDGSEQAQAAAFTYAYLTAVCNENIESYAFARQTDSVADDSAYGLRKTDGTPKAIFEVFRSIDTNEWKTYVAPLAQVLSVNDFSELIEGFDAASYQGGRTIIRGSAVPEENIGKEYQPQVMVDFSQGDLALFEPSDNTEYIEPFRPEGSEEDVPYVLYAKFATALTSRYSGISKVFPLGQSVAGSRYLTLSVNVSSEKGQTATLMLILSHGQNYTYKASANIPTNTAVTLSFDLQPILDGGYDVFHSLRLLAAPSDGDTLSGLHLGNIQSRVYTEADPMENLLVFAIVAVGIVICIAIVALVVIRVRTSRSGLVDSSYYEEETTPAVPSVKEETLTVSQAEDKSEKVGKKQKKKDKKKAEIEAEELPVPEEEPIFAQETGSPVLKQESPADVDETDLFGETPILRPVGIRPRTPSYKPETTSEPEPAKAPEVVSLPKKEISGAKEISAELGSPKEDVRPRPRARRIPPSAEKRTKDNQD